MNIRLLLLLGMILSLPAQAQQPSPDGAQADEDSRQREAAIERCKQNRGTDCETEAGLSEWLLQERSREEAEDDGSRSKFQTAPRPTPH
jgi:hypothetical protein